MTSMARAEHPRLDRSWWSGRGLDVWNHLRGPRVGIRGARRMLEVALASSWGPLGTARTRATGNRAGRRLLGKAGGLPGHHLPLAAVIDVHIGKPDAKTIGLPVGHDVNAG
jgi:hypothetical protein